MKTRVAMSCLGIFLVSCTHTTSHQSGHTHSSPSLPPVFEEQAGEIMARAKLEPRSGSSAQGEVIFAKTDLGLQVIARVQNIEPGLKGFHAHETGDCSAPDASSAGGHFNPGGKPHGHVSFHGRHAGDFGNIPVGSDGSGYLSIILTEEMNLGLESWEDFIGKSVVLHADPDDLKSQPAGDSGPRIACGIIEKAAH